jgi:hypothetical protein
MKKILFLVSVLTVLLYACKLEIASPTPDPNIKPKHVNKFTCKVNGKFWEAVPKEYDGSFKLNDLSVSFQPSINRLSISANNLKNGDDMNLSFPLYDSSRVITKLVYCRFDDDKCIGDYKIDTSNVKINIIKFNRDSAILVGNFNFSLIPGPFSSCKDTIAITEGFFNIKNR